MVSPVNIHQLAPDDPLSPELVLVLPAELRAQVLAGLPFPVWPAPRPRVLSAPPAADDPEARPLRRILVSRVTQFALIFTAITIVTLAMALVAQAVR